MIWFFLALGFVGIVLLACGIVALASAAAFIQPNDEPVHPLRRGFDPCVVSKFGLHNFIGMNRRCSFCGRELEDCIESDKAASAKQ